MPRPLNLPHPRDLALLRLAVGAAGEHCGWWRTPLTRPVGQRILAQLFPRTALRAVLESVTLAERRDHDARVTAVGFHLFRLSTQLEDRITGELDDTAWRAEWLPRINADVVARLAELGARVALYFAEGLNLLGRLTRTRHPRSFSEMAESYHRSSGGACFPPLRGRCLTSGPGTFTSRFLKNPAPPRGRRAAPRMVAR